MYIKHINILHLFIVEPKIVNRFVQTDIIDKIDTPFEQTTLILNCWSEHFIDEFGVIFEEVLKFNFLKVIILVDINSEKNFQQLPAHIKDGCELVVIDSIHILSARIVWGNRCLGSWNSRAKKGFFPVGTLSRYNRIGLLEKLYQSGSLSAINWTAPKSENQLENIVRYYQNESSNRISAEDFNEFYSYIVKNAVSSEHGISTHAYTNLVPFFLVHDHPIELYNDAIFILVSERSSPTNNSTIITEKIPLAIMNHRPFILAGHPGTLKRLQAQGFETFTKYLPYPNYDDVVDNDIRMIQIAENVKVFSKILTDHQEEVDLATKHNYLLLNQIADNTIQLLENFACKYNISYTSLEEEFGLNPWTAQHYVHLPSLPNTSKPDAAEVRLREQYYIQEFNRKDEDKLWLDHYNSIKGADWPDISSRLEFDLLPDAIKTECISQFDFHPNRWYMRGIPG
jgi:hypothetical protein